MAGRASNWHVTLRFFGEAEEDEVAARLDSTRADAGAVPRSDRPSHGSATASSSFPSTASSTLAGAVVDVTADVGKPPPRRRFSGHVTIARLRDGARCDLVGTPDQRRLRCLRGAAGAQHVAPRRCSLRRRGTVAALEAPADWSGGRTRVSERSTA